MRTYTFKLSNFEDFIEQYVQMIYIEVVDNKIMLFQSEYQTCVKETLATSHELRREAKLKHPRLSCLR